MDTTMRQRLLLVVGWLIAAIVSGLVASGAVAVAGGQVLDRALRPLTAAEVAALPVVTVGSPDGVEPQASGGFVPSTGEPTEGSVVDGTGSDEPPDTGGSSASVDIPEPTDAPIADPSPPSGFASNEGGQASFVATDDGILLLWATPQAGYVAQMRLTTPEATTVSFTSNRNVWLIDAALVDGELVVASRQVPLT
jgi:hypothetical protein